MPSLNINHVPAKVRKAIERCLEQGMTPSQIAGKVKGIPGIKPISKQLYVGAVRKAWKERLGLDLSPTVKATKQEMTEMGPEGEGPKKRDRDQSALREYRKHLRRGFPPRARAEALSHLAGKYKTAPFIAMRALEQIDKVDGMTQAAKEGTGPTAPGPMFQLPPGSLVAIRVVSDPEPRTSPTTSSAASLPQGDPDDDSSRPDA